MRETVAMGFASYVKYDASSFITYERLKTMAIIRPVSSLQRKIGELAKIAKDTGEPIFLTKNGVEHLVLMDADAFAKLQKLAEKNGK